MTSTDKVRMYASDVRVFAKADLVRRLGEEAARALQPMVSRGDLGNPAVGIYTFPGVLPDDPRVLAKIEQTGAKPVNRKTLEARARRLEEQEARRIVKEAKRETVPDQLRRFFKRQDVALVSELRRKIGPNVASGLDALVKEGFIRRVENGLYARPTVDPLGSVMRAYIEKNSIELATIKREIDEARRKLPEHCTFEHSDISYSVYTPPSPDGVQVRTRVYVSIPGYPVIYASAGQAGAPSWNGAKDGGLSRHAADHLARMIFEPMPETYAALVRIVREERAPRHVRRRSGGHDVDDRWRPRPETSEGPPHREDRRHARREGHERPHGYAAEGGQHRSRKEHQRRPSQDRGEAKYQQKGPYGTQDTDRLHPDRLSTPLPEAVTLEIDDRENDWLLTRLTGVPNLHVIRSRLPIGDFRARHGSRELLFERKTSSDLVASLQDGRMTTQVRALSEHGSPCCFIIEGGVFGSRSLPITKLAAMQSRLVFGMRMPIVETIDQAHTVYAIVTSIRDHFFGVGNKFDLEPVRLKGAGPIEIAKVMLETIPGISPARSTALLKRFGSVAGIARATVERLAEIDGIGKKTAEKLHEVLRAGA
ncbi:helix-hairpin-helix domain-containing protein [Sphingomonas sp. 3-13AW]|uniref:helix-hairpin-helix domain-containing protein n=1 Tax=Sphingomonas sp. 3-13AW TaxID=3050450 RepID=UPI003BB6CAC2